jgi:hypothetical protein
MTSSASSSSQIPLLRYFDIRGKAEAIRLLWEEAGQEYKVRRPFVIFLFRLSSSPNSN